MVENPITLDEFHYSIKVPDSLLTIGFFPNIIRSNCTVNNKEKFIINYELKNKNDFNIKINLEYNDGKSNIKLDDKNYLINYNENKCEIDIIFNKKGNYVLEMIIQNNKSYLSPIFIRNIRIYPRRKRQSICFKS